MTNKILLYGITCLLLLLTACKSRQIPVQYSSSPKAGQIKPQSHISTADEQRLQYFYLEAMNRKQKQDHAGAFTLLQHCLEINPHSAAVLSEIASYYFFLGQEEQGLAALRQAAKEDHTNYWYQMQLGNYYQQKNDWLKAITVFQDMAENFPRKLEPLMNLTMLYQAHKQYPQAIDALNRLEELDGKSEALNMQRFSIYQEMGEKEKAYAEIQQLIDEYPYDYSYQTILGDAYLQNNKIEEAHKIYSRILKEEPNYAPALVSMANYYQITHQDSLHKILLDSVLMNRDVDSELKQNIMLNLILQTEKGDRDSIRIANLMERVISRPQQNANLAMLCAQYLAEKKMKTQAIPMLHKVLELDPSNKPARLQLISYALTDKDQDRIISLTTPALQYNPDALEFYYYLGMAYFMKDDKTKALEIFKKGVSNVKPNTDKNIVSDFFAIMGDILHDKGNIEEAYAAYDSSLVHNPDNISTLNNYAYYLSVTHTQLDKAEEMSYKTVQAEPDNATYLDTYAWILFEKQKFTEARIYIDQALRSKDGQNSTILEHAGDIYWKLGNQAKALEFWKQAKTAEEKRAPQSTPRSETEMKKLEHKINLKRYIE